MKSIFTIFLMAFSFAVLAQSSRQVQWNYSTRRIADKTYEIHISANVNGKYHIYAQDAGVEGPMPTVVTFNKNPLVLLDGKVKENGKLIRQHEEVWGGMVNYYEKAVEFVQIVKLKANVKTSVSGKLEFMVCNDRECLAPSDVDFNVQVGG
jgi:hypothetical protein